MTTYIFKMVLCSAILLLFYRLFLEREKMHLFNRFYLLFSIAFSLVFPFISFEVSTPLLPIEEVIVESGNSVQNVFVQQADTSISENSPNYLLIFYFIITFCFLIRLAKNLLSMFNNIRNSDILPYEHGKLVLINENLVPHTFLRYVFLNKGDYEQGRIAKEILAHEMTHVRQKHSFDILLLELLLIVMWFNPFLFLYKKAIQLNHEFLADESVVGTLEDPSIYQRLLLSHAHGPTSLSLTSQFNYLITKKRLIMMTRTTSRTKAILRQITVLLLIAAIGFSASTRTVAQVLPKEVNVGKVESTTEGVSQQLLDEYTSIVTKYIVKDSVKIKRRITKKFTQEDRDRLETIFKQMSKEQQDAQFVVFMQRPAPSKKVVPTKEEIKLWQNAKVYGVWIDDKRVSNSQLRNYANTDFSHVFVSKLSKNAINYGKHYVQVDLMTNDHYEKYYQRALLDKSYHMGFRFHAKEAAK